MNYTWEITGIKRKDTSTIDNIIVQTYWKKIGTDENGNTAHFSGATPFDLSTVDPTNFVNYEDLTEEMVLSWIQSQVVGEYETHVNERISERIEEQINPITEETESFPWSPVDS
jgi:hypothetical protein